MNIEHLTLRHGNYVYVYHTGVDIDSLCFMGMTVSAYESARGTYNCACWVHSGGSLEDDLERIREDFSLPVEDRNVGRGISEALATDCATVWHRDVMPMYVKEFCGNGYLTLFDKTTLRGIVLPGLLPSDILLRFDDGLVAANIDMSALTIDVSPVLNSQWPNKRGKNITMLGYLTNLYHSESKYSLLYTVQNANNTVFSVQNVVLHGDIEIPAPVVQWVAKDKLYMI